MHHSDNQGLDDSSTWCFQRWYAMFNSWLERLHECQVTISYYKLLVFLGCVFHLGWIFRTLYGPLDRGWMGQWADMFWAYKQSRWDHATTFAWWDSSTAHTFSLVTLWAQTGFSGPLAAAAVTMLGLTAFKTSHQRLDHQRLQGRNSLAMSRNHHQVQPAVSYPTPWAGHDSADLEAMWTLPPLGTNFAPIQYGPGKGRASGKSLPGGKTWPMHTDWTKGWGHPGCSLQDPPIQILYNQALVPKGKGGSKGKPSQKGWAYTSAL